MRLEEWRAKDLRALVPWSLSCAAFTACALALLSPLARARSFPFLVGWLAVGLLTLLAGAQRLPFRLRATLFLCADYAVVLLAAAGSPYPGAIAFARLISDALTAL